ncbi:Pumilio-homology domain protein [Bonamia ostreae]|uniref:Pumilio-homology domain protein n=1 Tax=Bonamia ostreae TaxID=126728 RepID=A0ABV2AP52_9EUKA
MVTTAFSHFLLFQYAINGEKMKISGLFDKLHHLPLSLGQSKYGCKFASLMYSCLSPKQKKNFIREIKNNITEMVCDEHGWTIVEKCLTNTDDTVLIHKKIMVPIIKELEKENSNLIRNKNFLKTILRLILFTNKNGENMSENKNGENLDQILEDFGKMAFCKKSCSQRRNEILEKFLNPLKIAIKKNFEFLVETFFGCELLIAIIKESLNAKTTFPTLDKTSTKLAKTTAKYLASKGEKLNFKVNFAKRFVLMFDDSEKTNKGTEKLRKIFFESFFANFKKRFYDEKAENAKIDQKNVINWLKSNIVFAVLAIIKMDRFLRDFPVHRDLISAIKNNKKFKF